MPYSAPSLRACGCKVRTGQKCKHMIERDRQRKAAFDAKRPTARQRGYDSKWDKAREAFLKAHPHCAKCNQPATVVDHITPHRGDMKLFWNKANWQPLCTAHHSRWKQSQERQP